MWLSLQTIFAAVSSTELSLLVPIVCVQSRGWSAHTLLQRPMPFGALQSPNPRAQRVSDDTTVGSHKGLGLKTFNPRNPSPCGQWASDEVGADAARGVRAGGGEGALQVALVRRVHL